MLVWVSVLGYPRHYDINDAFVVIHDDSAYVRVVVLREKTVGPLQIQHYC